MASEISSVSVNFGAVSDVLIAGAGIIGLSLALELRRQGAAVTVLEQSVAFSGASSAAAGMLAAEDPHNPPLLLSFSRYSLSRYEDYLARLQSLSGLPVSFQTSLTVQYTAAGSHQLAERSVDPHQLGKALLAAARTAGVRIVEHVPLFAVEVTASSVEARTSDGAIYRAAQFVHSTGAWAMPHPARLPSYSIAPRKGQMLRVAMPASSPLREVHRAEHVYIVPRTAGPQAGTALIGATVEDAGFDLTINPRQLAQLRERAAALAPATAFVAEAPLVDAWAGLRPHTPDQLPFLGQLREREWIAAGHFRNGVLLAPGTAAVLADLLAGNQPPLDLVPFAPNRFSVLR